MHEFPDITVDIALDGETRLAQLKLQSTSFEMNVFFNEDDIKRLDVPELPLAPEEMAICAGKSCGAPAHWSRGPDHVLSVVFGLDDTTWDFGVWMPYSAFHKIKQLLFPLRTNLGKTECG